MTPEQFAKKLGLENDQYQYALRFSEVIAEAYGLPPGVATASITAVMTTLGGLAERELVAEKHKVVTKKQSGFKIVALLTGAHYRRPVGPNTSKYFWTQTFQLYRGGKVVKPHTWKHMMRAEGTDVYYPTGADFFAEHKVKVSKYAINNYGPNCILGGIQIETKSGHTLNMDAGDGLRLKV